MLSDEERAEIGEALTHYGDRRSGVLTALKLVQGRRGWLSDEDVRDVADLVGLTPDEVDSRATFYNLLYRKPVGRHVILVCDSFACWIMGYERVRDYLKVKLGVELGETTPDGRFTLLPIVCLGACHLAPAMLVDDDLHGPLTEAEIDRILALYP